MRAIGEDGQPKNPGARISIAQANVGGKQLVQTIVRQEVVRKNSDDEQTRIENRGVIDAEIVPSVRERAELTEEINQEDAAVDTKLRAKKLTGETPKRDERIQTR
jgi:hypothetical protein